MKIWFAILDIVTNDSSNTMVLRLGLIQKVNSQIRSPPPNSSGNHDPLYPPFYINLTLTTIAYSCTIIQNKSAFLTNQSIIAWSAIVAPTTTPSLPAHINSTTQSSFSPTSSFSRSVLHGMIPEQTNLGLALFHVLFSVFLSGGWMSKLGNQSGSGSVRFRNVSAWWRLPRRSSRSQTTRANDLL